MMTSEDFRDRRYALAAQATTIEITVDRFSKRWRLREARHKAKAGNCWAYYATCVVIKPLGNSCCEICGTRRAKP